MSDDKQAKLFREIINALPYPIAVFKADGIVYEANRALVEMVELKSANQLIGQANIKTSKIIKTLAFADSVKEAFRGKTISKVDLSIPFNVLAEEYKTKKKGTLYLEATLFPLPGEKGKPEFVVGAFSDVTDRVVLRKQIEESLSTCQQLTGATIKSLSRIIEFRDSYTAGHQTRVQQLACAIAAEMNLDPVVIEKMKIAGLVHDIGKILLPSEILSKPGALSDFEYAIVKNHPEAGRTVLDESDFDPVVIEIVTQHHERINGSGYPLGLKGDAITFEARIYGVADVVEAMAAHRPYRPALGVEAALKEIEDNKGILYDADVVVVCLRLFREKGFKFVKVPQKL